MGTEPNGAGRPAPHPDPRDYLPSPVDLIAATLGRLSPVEALLADPHGGPWPVPR